MMWHDGSWGGGTWLLMSLSMLLFWTLVVAGVVWLARTVGSRPAVGGGVSLPSPPPPTSSSARAILDERYARGELSDEEYRQRRDTLAAP